MTYKQLKQAEIALGATAEEGNVLAVVCTLIDAAVDEERKRCVKIVVDAADRQSHFASDLYTQHTEQDRECFRHAASRLRDAATDIRKGE